MRILAGDIGGTKTLLEISEETSDGTKVIAKHRYDSSAYDDFSDLVKHFLTQYDDPNNPSVTNACFGVAGPVEEIGTNTISKITNLPWLMDSDQIAQQHHLKKVMLINDFVAVGWGVTVLPDSDITHLQQGELSPRTNRLVIGAGTGLGVAQMVWCKDDYRVLGTEGGHADFAPVNDIQSEMLSHLRKQHGRVSNEFVLSGPGLVNIYRFLHHYRSGDQAQLDKILSQSDAGAGIAKAAGENTDQLAGEAMEIFIEIYGAVSGNFALGSMALGGVYIAGGIAPKIIKNLQTGSFIDAFNNKGKMADLNRGIPVAVVMNPEVGLIGTRYMANKL